MNTREINLFVFDKRENYDNTKRFIGESIFKSINCIENVNDFETEFNALGTDERIFLAVHVFYTTNIAGIRSFVTSGILEDYPVEYMYISEGDAKKIQMAMVDNGIPHAEIYNYHAVMTNLKNETAKAFTKGEILKMKDLSAVTASSASAGYPRFDYAIITALFEDEFDELKRIFDFPKSEEIEIEKKVFSVGYLLPDKKIKVIAATLNATGLVDSAVIATLMLELFKPKYLLMSGVCGGAKKYHFGDIIVAKTIFSFQKGKMLDHPSFLEFLQGKANEENKPFLFDKAGDPVDHHHLYDSGRNQIAVSIDHFELEHDAMIGLDTKIEDKLKREKDTICTKINAAIKEDLRFNTGMNDIQIAIEPIASGTMVINKKDYFEKVIKAIDRNAAAVEMESYGVARACQFANNGQTKPIIFKSVMDHTFKKEDSFGDINVKKFAAYTSAQFMKGLFETGVI